MILFKLLARRMPYHLDQLPMHEVARVIEQEEPSRLGSIDRLYRGDVEIIVAKALEKDRTRRYASAGDLASDIRRYLRGEPILPGPPRRCTRSASSLGGIRRWWPRSRASSPRWSWGPSSRSCSRCVPRRTPARPRRVLVWRANGSATPRTRATAPASRRRAGALASRRRRRRPSSRRGPGALAGLGVETPAHPARRQHGGVYRFPRSANLPRLRSQRRPHCWNLDNGPAPFRPAR